MSRAIRHQNNFAEALRRARQSKGLTQEAFELVSSRTYVSSLERGLKSPTLNKVDDLAAALAMHPLTLLALSYVRDGKGGTVASVLATLESELDSIAKPAH